MSSEVRNSATTSIHLPNVQAQFEPTSELFKQLSHALHLPYGLILYVLSHQQRRHTLSLPSSLQGL